uniref:Uncharacterized protein n=1 Tax=Glossina brevipalpis TaxID=37001 RepID=A0A1A9X506_9MUSC
MNPNPLGLLTEENEDLPTGLHGTKEFEKDFQEIFRTFGKSVLSNPDDLNIRPTIRPDGCAATYFPEKISDLKAKLHTILNNHYGNFDDKTKKDFIEKNRNFFIYNSPVLRSVNVVNRANIIE